ncbi:hypothetical protein FRB97_007549 [Tulasnella sp. 331]|nr:hypothetical protein FRB97_007549 [Tulasnella sp. 331]
MIGKYHISILTALLWPGCFVGGQATTNAICSPKTAWMKNAAGQTPCLVAAYLSGACNGSVWFNSAVVLPGPYRHPAGNATAGPTKCRCSGVVYNLEQACSLCQGGAVGSWSEWTSLCDPGIIDASGFPADTPDGTIIPGWAGLDPTTAGSWNATQASQYASLDATVTISSVTQASSQYTIPIPLAANPSQSLTPGNKKSDVGAIVGGVVSGSVSLILLNIGIFFYLCHRRQTREPKGDLISPTPYMADDLDQSYIHHHQGCTCLPAITDAETSPSLNAVSPVNASPSSFGAMSNSNEVPVSLRPYK